jgi:hypothetical protein
MLVQQPPGRGAAYRIVFAVVQRRQAEELVRPFDRGVDGTTDGLAVRRAAVAVDQL